MSRPVYIYGLWDPRSSELRYIGKTVDPDARLKKHIREAQKKGATTYIRSWILGLLEEDLEPLLEILEETDEAEWRAIERDWIKQCREHGLKLVNLCKGGEGGAYEGHEVSEVTRQKMRDLWADPEWRAKMMEARRKSSKPKGWQAVSEEQRRAFREKRKTWAPMKGRKFTEEHKARIGAANAIALEGRKVSPKFRKHLAKIGQERWTRPGERERASERAKGTKRNEKGQFVKS